MSCRICLEEEGPFVHPCLCKGSSGDVHAKCLSKWVEESEKTHCEICKHEYYKTEVMACNTKRCCGEFFKCRVTRDADILFRKFGGMVFVTSCFSLVFIDADYMVVASCVSSLLLSMVIMSYAIHYYEHNIGLYNAALCWKMAFSMPYVISILILYIQYEDMCDMQCISMHKQCTEECPVYDMFETKTRYLINMWLYDLSILAILFIVRMAMLSYFHMRKLKFQDLVLGDEGIPLLSDEEP